MREERKKNKDRKNLIGKKQVPYIKKCVSCGNMKKIFYLDIVFKFRVIVGN